MCTFFRSLELMHFYHSYHELSLFNGFLFVGAAKFCFWSIMERKYNTKSPGKKNIEKSMRIVFEFHSLHRMIHFKSFFLRIFFGVILLMFLLKINNTITYVFTSLIIQLHMFLLINNTIFLSIRRVVSVYFHMFLSIRLYVGLFV